MSLITWLPLISNTENQGLSTPTITTYGTMSYSAGKLGNALNFTNHAVVIDPAPINTNTTEFSFAFWLKTTSGSATQCIYNGRTTVGGPVSIFLLGGKWRFDDGAQHTLSSGAVVNEWHHYVFTRDNTNIKYYKDGVLTQTVASTAFTLTPKTASIGRSSANGGTPSGNVLLGQLQDFRIYDHVLSKKEIKLISQGLVLHLPLDWGGPYTPEISDTDYTRLKFNTRYLTDCSGFDNEVTSYGSNMTSCISPRYNTGTTCGSNSCINLRKSTKISAPFSCAFWFNTSSLELNSNRLISCTESGGWNIEARNSGITFPVYANSGYRYCDSVTTRSQLINNWHHIVCTYDGFKSQMYIDGVLDAEVTHFTTFYNITYNANNSVFLGGEAQGGEDNPVVYTTSTNFSDFRFYASILSADDVKALYNNPFSVDRDGKFYGYNLVED